jgi:outer membrane protein assembly factor BamB
VFRRIARHRCRSLRALLPLLALPLLLPAVPAAADLAATTIPIQAEGPTLWTFAGDKAIVRSATKKGGEIIGHFDAYTVVEPKPIWHADLSFGKADVEVDTRILPDSKHDQWYVGTGPFSLLDIGTGTIRWTIPCDKIGFVDPSHVRVLSGDRMLTVGTKKCDPGSAFDALKEPVFSMVDTKTGSVLWSYATKSYEYELGLGFWAKVAQYQGRRVQKEKRIQIEYMLASPSGGDFDYSGPEADRLVVVGERFEGIRLSDGSPLYKTKDKVGVLRGAFDGKVFCRDGDKVTAYDVVTGGETWTFDLKKKNTSIYTIDDMRDLGYGVPDEMRDIMISEVDIVSRVSVATGKAVWTVKRGGMSWQGSVHGFLTKSGDKIVAYDWNTGTKLWESKVGSKPKAIDSGEYIVCMDGADMVDGTPLPPFKFTVVNGKTGQILWSKKDVDGKKIIDYGLEVPGQIWIQTEGLVQFLSLADGTSAGMGLTAAAAGAEGNENGYSVSFYNKGVRCRDASGKTIWERKGSKYFPPKGQPRNGLVIWTTSDGDVEVIGAADGSTKWKTKTEKESYVVVNDDWSCMIVPGKKSATFVRLAP